MLTLNLTNADSFLPQDYLTSRKPRLEQAAECGKMAINLLPLKDMRPKEFQLELL